MGERYAKSDDRSDIAGRTAPVQCDPALAASLRFQTAIATKARVASRAAKLVASAVTPGSDFFRAVTAATPI